MFLQTSADIVIRLARSLACMPLFLPIMRLVQQVMHPETELHQLSEIFYSGMLHRRDYSQPIGDETNPDEIEYDFMPGLRDRFLDNSSFVRIAKCADFLDRYVNSRFGQPNSFAAILRDPTKAKFWPSGESQQNQASFARVFSNVLKRLGGEYADAANLLEPKEERPEKVPSSASPQPVALDGLLTIDEIHQAILASGELKADDQITGECLLFDNYNPRQHTWLVSTQTKVIIVLDDENTRAKRRLIQRVMIKDNVFPLSFGPKSECTVGFAAKPVPRWYYSTELFPTQRVLREAIARLIQSPIVDETEELPVTNLPLGHPELVSAHSNTKETDTTEDDAIEGQSGYPFADVELEDGTNIRRGTIFIEKPDSWPADLYIPAKASATEGWQDRLRNLRRKFTYISNSEDRVSCRITQRLIPQFPNTRHSNSWLEESQERMFQGGGGLSRDFCRLEGPSGEWLMAEFPFVDAKGALIQNSAGQPYAFRYGMSRSTFLLRDAKRRDNNVAIRNACMEGTNLLYELPSKVATHIWANWETGFSKGRNSDEYFWLNSLFEIGWQKSASRKLRLSRFAWSGIGRSMVELPNGPLFPRLPASNRYHESIGTDIPHYMGYPVEIYSELRDVAQYSVDVIDHLLSHSGKQYDFYVCHSSKDRDVAQELIDRLSDLGLKSFVQRAGFLPDEDFSEIAKRAASESKLFLVVASESFVASGLQMHELDIAFDCQRKDPSLKIVTLTMDSSRPATEIEPRLYSTQILPFRNDWIEVLSRISALLSDDQSDTSQIASIDGDLAVEFKRIDSVSVQKLKDWVKGRTVSSIRRSNVQVLLHRDLTGWLSYCRDFENSLEWHDVPSNTREQVQSLTQQVLVKEIPDIKRGIEIILRDFHGEDCRSFAEIIRQFVEAKVVAILRVLCSMRCVGMKAVPWHSKYEKMFPQYSTDIMAGLVVTCAANNSETFYWTEVDIYRKGEKTGRRAFLPFNLILSKRLNQPIREKDVDRFLTPQFVDQELRSQDSLDGNAPLASEVDFVDRRENFWETEEFKSTNYDSEMLASIRRAATSVLQQFGHSALDQFSTESKSWRQVVTEASNASGSLTPNDASVTVSANQANSMSEELPLELRRFVRNILGDALPSQDAVQHFVRSIAIDNLAQALRDNLSYTTLGDAFNDLIAIAHSRHAVGDLLLELSRILGPTCDEIAVAGALFAEKYQNAKSASTRAICFDVERSSVEKLTSLNPFLNIEQLGTFLDQAERRICKVKCEGFGRGTGFLIGKDLVLTCFHVIESGKSGKPYAVTDIEVEFDSLYDVARATTTYRLSSDWVIPFSKYSDQDLKEPPSNAEPDALDYAVLKLSKAAGADVVDGQPRGFFDIGTHKMPPTGTPILIAGHPGPHELRPLRVSMAFPGYEGLSLNKTRVIYTSKNEIGLSGSPVFDHNFNLICVHHNRGETHPTDSQPFRNNRGIPMTLIADALSRGMSISSLPPVETKHSESEARFAVEPSLETRRDPALEYTSSSDNSQLQKQIVDWLANAPVAVRMRIVIELDAGASLPLGIAPAQVIARELVRWATATGNLERLAHLIRSNYMESGDNQ